MENNNFRKLRILACAFDEIDADGNGYIYPPEVKDFLWKQGKSGYILCDDNAVFCEEGELYEK